LDSVLELKVQRYFLVALLVSQNGDCLARVVIAVVKEKDDFSSDFLLESPGRSDFSEQKSLWKKSTRLLAKTNNRVIHRLVLCNRYSLPIAARSLGEFQEASEAPVSIAILAEQATRKFAQRTAARRFELKMARRLRCVSITGRKGHASSSRLGGGPF
jgi:hypothetical protein